MSGPLDGVTVIEVGGIGPGPFAGMILADMGATVIRVDRPGASLPLPLPVEKDLSNRGKRMVALDLKRPEAIETLLTLVGRADILIEGYRPGVAERLGFGPEVCHARNPRLVFGRMTGWGQTGPWASAAGHDVNYVAITGALHALGEAGGPPAIPLNLVGDYAGGSSYLVMGVLAALWEAGRTGRGQVIDAAIVDGVSHLMSGTWSFLNAGIWRDERGVNLIDGGAPFYDVYATSDGRHLAVGPIEPAFWTEMLRLLEIAEPLPRQDPARWPEVRAILADAFARRTLEEWTDVFAGSDACVSPVVSLREAPRHPHLAARGTLREVDGEIVPAPAPRFSGHPLASVASPAPVGAHTTEVLRGLGLDVEALLASGTAFQAEPVATE
ncbi:MAG: CaiB/BaiF CoA-transferase family protein [Nocardioides sp.]|uniref:CaiB/BaiF CoA transferase family protein n=1 Tax=Nocardioides sp. TaxID=35761 RepID=UPI0039E39CDF